MKKLLILMFAFLCSVGMWAQKVTLDFTNAKNDWGMPTSGVKDAVKTYTNGDYTIEIWGDASNGHKAQTGYIITGKKDGYIKLPKMNFPVGKIVVGGKSGASGSTKFNIFVGENAVSTEVTGCTSDQTFDIASANQAAGTEYTIKITSAHNLQVTKVEFYEAGTTPSKIDVTGVNLDKTSETLFVNQTTTLTATVLPANASNKNVTWSSSDDEVATVDNTGKVTAVGMGNATITVKTADQEKTATCSITVKDVPTTGTVYNKVTSDLSDWSGKYLIVYETENVALDGSLGSGLDKAANTVSVSASNGVINGTTLIDDAVVTIEAVEGGFSLSAGGIFFGISSYSNGLKVNANTPYVNNLECDADGNIIISQSFDSGTMILNFNSNSSDKRFRYYKEGSQKKIQLYKLQPKSFDLTIGDSEWASMYLDFAAEVPEGATAYYASNVEDEIITLKSVKAGEVLPANTGVLVNGASCTFAESDETPATVTGNLFEGVTEATPCEARSVWVLNTASTKDLGDPVLSLYTGTSLGANKAYLPVANVPAGAKTLKVAFDDDNTVTGINTVSTSTANGVVYNLAGQRVAANQKGIIIVNGKKFINK